jgi:YbgC/YbaW family acyl-CoA thioester hydrolase
MEKIDLTRYNHITEVKVRFMDIDALQHVNNARYLNFLEEARISYSQEVLGIFEKIDELNILVARIEIDFMKPIFYNSKVKIYTRVSNIGTKSFEFESVICVYKNGENNIVSKSIQTLVAFDPNTGKTVEISDKIKGLILDFENNQSE